jgi:hypothetical protein
MDGISLVEGRKSKEKRLLADYRRNFMKKSKGPR